MILKLKDKYSFKLLAKSIEAEDLIRAEQSWIKEFQNDIRCKLLLFGIKGVVPYKGMTPRINEDGRIVIGGRAERWVEILYNKREIHVLPKEHRFSLLYCEYIHESSHLGVDADVAKIIALYQIIGATHTCTLTSNIRIPNEN